MFSIEQDKWISRAHDYAADRAEATLLTTGNGYLGVRGSYEEYSELGIQGAYVRGFLDEVIEICVPNIDSVHLKREYFDEEALKTFERQECGINVADLLTLRVAVGGKPFFMHEGVLKSFVRELDVSTGVLTRRVVWDDGEGAETRLTFERFASFADDHLYCQRLTVEPLNHDKPVSVLAGFDLRVKTQGQIVTRALEQSAGPGRVHAALSSGPRYGFRADLDAEVRVFDGAGNPLPTAGIEADVLACRAEGRGRLTVEKFVYVTTSRDEDGADAARALPRTGYEAELAAHLAVYRPLFAVCDMRIAGDERVDGELRFCNYHTLISACRNDGVHGVSAKGLTGEKYDQYVWWDSEIYQLPYFLATRPETAKQILRYRCRTLAQAKRNAAEKGLQGARFAFCSGVTGTECVWSFARHPFLQDHITADVAFAVLNYHRATGDEGFLDEGGLELLAECCRYWLSRAVRTERGWEIRNVTGPDEHHAGVDNDAYTNYLVRFDCLGAAELLEARPDRAQALGCGNLARELRAFATELVLPSSDSGLIPQFDGYFDKRPDMEAADGQHGLQMKYRGSYAASQIIKQPDVLLLYSYADVGLDRSHYAENLDFYEHRCECSSSLSYAPHAVCSAHNRRVASFYEYLRATVEMDLDNRHGGVEEGIHAGCAAGGYLAVLYGLFGVRYEADALCVDPRQIPWWKSVSIRTIYQNVLLKLEICGKLCVIHNESGRPVRIKVRGRPELLGERISIGLE